ncbi:MAG: patatin-like phospholipase family protein [Pseudohongiellaceae bacterium]
MSTTNKTVSLVLGSGGARGYAHIGVIRWIEEQGLEISSVVGCSMGALVGGCYAAGKLDEYADWACEVRKSDIVQLLDFTLSKKGFVDGSRLIKVLQDFVGDHQIEELSVRYTAVAADIDREKEVWINSGPLFDAIRASIAMPFFFLPYEKGGRMLLDGGILNPVPIAPTFDDQTDFTIAVNLNGPPDDDLPMPDRNRPEPEEKSRDMRSLIDRFFNGLQEQFSKGDSEDWTMLDIAQQTLDSMQSTIARSKLAAYPPDVIVPIPRECATIMEFDLADELIDLGYKSAEQHIGTYLKRHDGQD